MENNKWRMPAEYEEHDGTLMIWPVRPGSFGIDASKAKKAFVEIIKKIIISEKAYLLVDNKHLDEAKAMLPESVNFIVMDTDDAWARDTGPTFVKNKEGAIIGIDWEFNAWGGEFDGLYANYENDNLVASKFCKEIGKECYNAHPFILEGGSIHTDGEGTLMTTESCLLSEGRNSNLSKNEIEETLLGLLGAKKMLWLPRGIYNDETNEHVDNICAFVKPGEVVLAWTDDENDPQYPLSKACYDYLLREVDACGRKITIHKLPIPKNPICIEDDNLDNYEFEDGEDERVVGERLAASYVNFYITNDGILLPQFGDENDKEAVRIMQKIFPDRKIYPIYAKDILLGGGNIHCITQQIPKEGL